MDAADLAREVCTFDHRRDRPSPLVLIVCPIGATRLLKETAFKITAPVEDGRQIIRCDIPAFPPPRSRRTVLDYDRTNLDGAASCIEGYMLNNNVHELRLLLLEVSDGGWFENDRLVGRWTFAQESQIQNGSRLISIQSILKSLFTRD